MSSSLDSMRARAIRVARIGMQRIALSTSYDAVAVEMAIVAMAFLEVTEHLRGTETRGTIEGHASPETPVIPE